MVIGKATATQTTPPFRSQVEKTEYSVHDLLYSFLELEFDAFRLESTLPGYAVGASRIDFVLTKEKITVEAKISECNSDVEKNR